MGDWLRSSTLEDLPLHLILEILTSGCRLSGSDLVCVELTSSVFRGTHGFDNQKSKSLADFAAFQLGRSHFVYNCLSFKAQDELVGRCGQNWKMVLRFLKSVNQSSDVVHTTSGNIIKMTLQEMVGFIGVLQEEELK
ncbi:hypothetical protein Hanom_Chr08g00728101 [Helianthus anomalus]